MKKSGATLKINLSQKVKGEKLVDITKKSLDALEGYETSIEYPYYQGCHAFYSEIKKCVRGCKSKEGSVDFTFKGKLKILYAFPIFGWMLYFKEKRSYPVEEIIIEAALNPFLEYNKLELKVTKRNYLKTVSASKYNLVIDKDNISDHPEIKKDLDNLEKIISIQVNS